MALLSLGNLFGYGASGLGGAAFGALSTGVLTLIVLALVWKLIWYGMALYRAVERKQFNWFVVLFVATFILGDLGILAIIYLLIYRDKKTSPKAKKRR